MSLYINYSKVYNVFQTGVTAVAIFTGGMTTNMKCFVAGTLVLTVNGLVAIETIKQGDIVYAANADTFIVSPRKVLETFVNLITLMVHKKAALIELNLNIKFENIGNMNGIPEDGD